MDDWSRKGKEISLPQHRLIYVKEKEAIEFKEEMKQKAEYKIE